MFLLQGMGMILANLLAIGIIVLVAWLFLRRGPVTESKLRRMVKADSIPARDVLPCGGDLGATGALLRALDLGGQPRDLIRALMVDWVQQKAVFTRSSPKKKLRSFGADVQLELYFPEESPALSGTAALLYDAVRSWAEAEACSKANSIRPHEMMHSVWITLCFSSSTKAAAVCATRAAVHPRPKNPSSAFQTTTANCTHPRAFALPGRPLPLCTSHRPTYADKPLFWPPQPEKSSRMTRPVCWQPRFAAV